MSNLKSIISVAERRIKALAQRECGSADVFSFGVPDIHPRHLAFWIKTQSDEERDRLQADAELRHKFRSILLELGYPAEAVPLVGFAFESQETVDRDFGGNWYHATK